jgi:hypothetical protein
MQAACDHDIQCTYVFGIAFEGVVSQNPREEQLSCGKVGPKSV